LVDEAVHSVINDDYIFEVKVVFEHSEVLNIDGGIILLVDYFMHTALSEESMMDEAVVWINMV
jgi:hypothetical protein